MLSIFFLARRGKRPVDPHPMDAEDTVFISDTKED
jgi:hypothetical protein